MQDFMVSGRFDHVLTVCSGRQAVSVIDFAVLVSLPVRSEA